MADVLEAGRIYFVYRPRVQEESPEGIEDIQRFHVILSPRGRRVIRLITVGRKRLPEIDDGGQRVWGFVEKVGRQPKDMEDELERQTYQTRTRGERVRPAARPAGEGVYALVRHGDHTHLAYRLELPERPGEVQQELGIPETGSYVISVKNPGTPSLPRAGLSPEQRAAYPEELMARFGDRRFIELDPPDFLDHEGTEILLMAARREAEEELGIQLEPELERGSDAKTFEELGMDQDEHPAEPLFRGEWT